MAARFPPWFRDEMMGAVGGFLPDVRDARLNGRPSFLRAWASRREHDLRTRFAGNATSRRLFEIPELGDADSRAKQVEGSLNHRTISARLRFLDFSHEYLGNKRRRGEEPMTHVVRRDKKDVRKCFNYTAGASRFIYNQALAFINKQPRDEQAGWFNKARLYPILVAQRKNKEREIRAQKADESDVKYQNFLDGKAKSREKLRDNREKHDGENLLEKHAWLRNVSSHVLIQALKTLEEAFKAGIANQQKARQANKPVKAFKLHYKKRSDPTGWTFTMPSVYIKAEHVPRPTDGKAVRGQPLPQRAPATWTKLTLPHALGGSGDVMGKAGFGGVVFLTQKVDLANGRLLADVDFSRDRLGRWHAHVQRAPLKAPRSKPIAERRTAFNDPGSRTGHTMYLPDGRHHCRKHAVPPEGRKAQVVEYLQGDGGATDLFAECLKVDRIVASLPKKPLEGELPTVMSKEEFRLFKDKKKKEYRLRASIYNKVRDAHIRIAADVWSRVDTLVDPVFNTHKMAKKPMSADDPRRKISCKTVRQLFSLRHGALRDRLRHSADTMGKEYSLVTEEYTTIGCPCCLRVNDKFTGEVFNCRYCGYTAPRDIKSGLTLAVKYLRPGWRSS